MAEAEAWRAAALSAGGQRRQKICLSFRRNLHTSVLGRAAIAEQSRFTSTRPPGTGPRETQRSPRAERSHGGAGGIPG